MILGALWGAVDLGERVVRRLMRVRCALAGEHAFEDIFVGGDRAAQEIYLQGRCARCWKAGRGIRWKVRIAQPVAVPAQPPPSGEFIAAEPSEGDAPKVPVIPRRAPGEKPRG